MTVSVVLDEGDLRAMPRDLRDRLLKWYFEVRQCRAPSAPPPGRPTAVPSPAILTTDNDSRRLTFAKLVGADLLNVGQEIQCRALKRQQRDGKPKYISGARVSPQGTVEYAGKSFSNPSTLAVAMVKHSGGKPTALNGFDYLVVQSENGLVPLKKLRDRYSRWQVLAEGAVEDAKNIYGMETEAEDHLPHLRKLLQR
jgi:hypothetical protein